MFHQTTKAIALLFGHNIADLDHFSICNQNQSISTFGHLSPKYQGYSLTFWPNIGDLGHFSIWNQNQSISNLVISHQNTKVIALLFGQKSLIWITCHSAINLNQFSIWLFFTKIPRLWSYFLTKISLIWITFQSAINLNQFWIWLLFHQNTKVIALLFGQKSLIWITFQSAIKLNQFQIWLFFTWMPRL